jgi:phage-related protein (TIGR01555 family)
MATKKTKTINNNDGWGNVFTGLGRQNIDKRSGMTANWSQMSWEDIENIYGIDDMAEKIVKLVLEEAFRKDVIFSKKTEDQSENLEFNEKLWDYLNSINFWPKYMQAAEWGRLYGTGFLVFGFADKKSEKPYMEGQSIEWFQPMHKFDLNPSTVVTDPSQKNFRLPSKYRITTGDFSATLDPSRMVRFNGAILPQKLFIRNNYSHDSVLNKTKNAIMNFNAAYDSVAVLLQDFAGGVFKMKNLANLIAGGKEKDVISRLSLVDLKRSLVKSIVIDTEEEFKREATSLAGIKDVLQEMGARLVGASNMPHTLLLGEGSAGNLSGAGESEMTQWFNYVKGKQSSEYYPTLRECLLFILKDKKNPVTQGKVPEGFEITFPSLEEMNDQEKADIRLKTAQADEIYIRNQVLEPDEVALSRFKNGEFNPEKTEIDEDIRTQEDPTPEEPEVENDPKKKTI